MKLDEVLAGFVGGGKAAGASALVLDMGREAYFGSYGLADKGAGVKFERDTLCHVYSMTKLITCAALLTLFEAGVLRLDQPVADFCPEYRHMARVRRDLRSDKVEIVEAQTPVTFWHLLTMTSGMPYEYDAASPAERAVHARIAPLTDAMNESEKRGEGYTAARFAREMAGVPLLFEPGAAWHYGLSLDVIGGLIEIITGQSLYRYMKTAIFDKLNMRETYFNAAEGAKSRVARIYTLGGGRLAPWRAPDGLMPLVDARAFCSGGGGLIMPIDDYAKFANMLALGGEFNGARILRPETVRLMRSDALPDAIRHSYNWIEERGYGYGLSARVMREPSLSHYAERPGAFGWNGMAGTSVRIYPDAGRVALFYIQLVPALHAKYLPEFVRAVNAL